MSDPTTNLYGEVLRPREQKVINAPYKRPPKEAEITPQEKRRIREIARMCGENEYPEAREPALSEEIEFRHKFWQDKRAKVVAALEAAGTGGRQMENFRNCGAEAIVERDTETGKLRIRASYCKSRHCEPCMRAKSALITGNLRDALSDRKHRSHRFITLTLKHSSAPLAGQIKRLYASYKKLRQDKAWKRSQAGGAATLEVKWSPDSKMWHPHLHIISEGTYLPTAQLSNIWKAITGDSFIVDIRVISAEKDVAYYVGKYVTKGTNAEVYDDPQAAVEWIKAIKGVRMCATFGTWRGLKLLKKPKDSGTWKPVAQLAVIVRRAAAGDVESLNVLRELHESNQYNPHKPRTKRGPNPEKRQ